jgi:histidyl-tRNA synthetase
MYISPAHLVPWRLQVKAQLLEQGVDNETSTKILSVMACRSLEELEQILGECDALNDLKQLFEMAKGYGFDRWIECDASVVRGLAYYTGASDVLLPGGHRLDAATHRPLSSL